MKKEKIKRLEKAGWKVGTAEEFLGLSPEEAIYIEIKLRLSNFLREMRKKKKMRQQDVAKKIKSSQPRIAMAEAGDPSVSIDLLVRTLTALGATKKQIAQKIYHE